MYSKAKILGHPIHPMFVAFPIVFYTVTLIAFFVYQYFSPDIFWFKLGYFCNDAGVAMAVLAAIPGTIDWAVGIPERSAAKNRGLLHMALNVGALILFASNAWRLYGTWYMPPDSVASFWIISLIGVALTWTAAYHGWELVATHKVGVVMTPAQQRLEPTDKMDREDHQIDARPMPI